MKPFNYTTRGLLAVITVLIATTTSVDVFAQSKGSILVYVTADGDGEGDYPADAFNVGLPSILTNHGYDVTLTDRIETPQVTSTLLESFDQLWILSTDGDTIGPMVPTGQVPSRLYHGFFTSTMVIYGSWRRTTTALSCIWIT